MKKKDAEIPEKKDAKNVIEEIEKDQTSLQDRIQELEAKIRESEEAALARVCKALGVQPEDVKEKEDQPLKDTRMIRMWVQTPVRVNMNVYHGDVTIPIETARVIQQAIGDRQQRLLRELTGSSYVLQEIQPGKFAPRLVSKISLEGERIA